MNAINRHTWEEHYRTGPTPWDTRITPPEVVQFWRDHPAPAGGLALDLGCGPATNVAYLAALGLRVIGFDLAGNALATGLARLRREQPHLLPHVQLAQADVAQLPLDQAQACYILDIGCLHGLPLEQRQAYAKGVIDNLAPGGYYQLYAFDLLADRPERGLDETEVADRFAPHLRIAEIIRANPDRHPCRWYLFAETSGGMSDDALDPAGDSPQPQAAWLSPNHP